MHSLSAPLLAIALLTACDPLGGEVRALPEVFQPADYLARVRKNDDGREIEYLEAFLDHFVTKVAADFPFRAGMTREEVKQRVQRKGYIQFHLVTEKGETVQTSATYWFNGEHQYWVDIAFADDRVSSVFIVPGNASGVSLGFRFDGHGPHRGMWVGASREE